MFIVAPSARRRPIKRSHVLQRLRCRADAGGYDAQRAAHRVRRTYRVASVRQCYHGRIEAGRYLASVVIPIRTVAPADLVFSVVS